MIDLFDIYPNNIIPEWDITKYCLVDVRSPIEFNKGHVPGAINLPLFSDAERADIGILYKKLGNSIAIEQGVKIITPRLKKYLLEIKFAAQGRHLLIMCWRGGMRSHSVSSELCNNGIPASRLVGGYKAWRSCLINCLGEYNFDEKQIYVLCGSTGVGKTEVLTELHREGYPIIDLEALANHRGSIFGHIGKGQPSNASYFDSMLLTELRRLKSYSYLIFECESKRIGNIYLPDNLYKAIKSAKQILIKSSIKCRIERLIKEYTGSDLNVDLIMKSVERLKKKLGSKNISALKDLLEKNQIYEFIELLLIKYYDPLYGYEMRRLESYDFFIENDNMCEIIRCVKNCVKDRCV